jgi:anti-sigma B factor antagonist
MSFSYLIEREDELMIVSLNGSLIAKPQVDGLFIDIENEMIEGGKNLMIDLTDMEYMNSTGLNVLINLLTQTRNKGGDVVIVNVPEKINKLLVITKLNSVFNIKENRALAKTELTKANES